MSSILNNLYNRAVDIFSCGARVGEEAILHAIGSLLSRSNNGIPANDEQVITYYTTTNNIETITYKLNGKTVAIQTLTYLDGATSDNDKLINSKVTYP